jgi:hypothetical protein
MLLLGESLMYVLGWRWLVDCVLIVIDRCIDRLDRLDGEWM